MIRQKEMIRTLRKNAIESIVFLSKSMYITDSNQYAIELVTYLLVVVVYFYKFIVNTRVEISRPSYEPLGDVEAHLKHFKPPQPL